MKITIQKTVSVVCLIVFMLIMACGAKKMEILPDETADAVETASVDAQNIEEEETAPPPEAESIPEGITIDFPFPWTSEGVYDNHTLILVCTDESAGMYELRLYDGDKNMVQQIPCGKLTEPIRFSYDSFTTALYADLEIFSDGAQNGLLFITDLRDKDEEKLFLDEAIEIPAHYECA